MENQRDLLLKTGNKKGGQMKKFKILAIAMVSCMAFASCGTPGTETSSYKQISAEAAMELMEKEEDYVILDVRTQEEYDEKHIPGAILIPNETIGTEEISELPDKEQMIFVYCRSGNRSKQASEKLVKLGYTNVVEFGGIEDWTGEVE